MPLPRLETEPVHLGKGASAVRQPPFPRDERAMQWYADYTARNAADGDEARLVSQFTFTESWPGWEVHPAGEELVVCLSGSMVLIQDLPEGEQRTVLSAGEYAINPRGVWHTADIEGVCEALFITPGVGTQHRPR